MTEQSTWLTPAAFAKLTAELEDLKTEGRRLIEIRLAEARAHGDLRENGDYDSAKNDQGMMEARIRQLDAILAHAIVRMMLPIACKASSVASSGPQAFGAVLRRAPSCAGRSSRRRARRR